jgi:outer membrane protein assembly factor BamB
MLRSTWFLAAFAALSVTSAFGQSLEERYWLALNEGRDLSTMHSVVEKLAGPGRQVPPRPGIRAEALRLLDVIESTAPLNELVIDGNSTAPTVGPDWPSLGGNAAHTGTTTQPGPTLGKLVWQYPVGWPWKAAACLDADRVYLTTPALPTALLCLDRKTGREIWSAENPHIGFHRQIRGSSTPVDLGDGELGLYQQSFDGWVLSYLVINSQDGRVLRRVPAKPQETRHEPPELQPRQLVAHAMNKGSEVLVKSLKSGRTWWRFSTGPLSSEPVIDGQLLYATGSDGTLWALHLTENQRIAWTYQVDGSWGAEPSVVGGTLYIGDNTGTVHAIDAASGKCHWKTTVTSRDPRSRQLFSKAAVSDRRVYLGAADGILYALDRTTGQQKWQHDCGDWIRSRPFCAGEIVCAATLEGKVVAVRDDGDRATTAWTADTGRHPIYADLAGDAEGVLATTSDFQVAALDLHTGERQWRRSLIRCTFTKGMRAFADSMPDIAQAPVTVAQGRVFFTGRDGFVIAADAVTGRRLWRFESGGRVSAGLTTRDGRVFVGQIGGNQVFYALDSETGHPLWSRRIGEVWASPECDAGQLFVGNKEGMFYCLDPEDGRTIWQRKVADGVYPAPAVDARRVYTGSWDGNYYAMDRNRGQVVWAFCRPGRPYHLGGRPDSAAPILTDGLVVVPNLGGSMIALNAESGSLQWEWKGIPWRICNVTAATDGRIVLASVFGNAYEFPFDTRLFALDLTTGRQLWELPGPGGLTAPVLTAGGRFTIGSMGSPFLYGYQLGERPEEPPQLLWRLKTGGVMYESLPAVSGNLGFFLSNDGWMRAVQ